MIQLDIDGHKEQHMFLYVVLRLVLYDVILGLLWMRKHNVQVNPLVNGL
jgi:hypothetical protein